MNKKLATALFVLGGTVVNLILMLTFIVALLFATNGALNAFSVDPESPVRIFSLIIAIFGGLVLAFIVYSQIMKRIQKKYDLEKYMDPIFKQKRKW